MVVAQTCSLLERLGLYPSESALLRPWLCEEYDSRSLLTFKVRLGRLQWGTFAPVQGLQALWSAWKWECELAGRMSLFRMVHRKFVLFVKDLLNTYVCR